MVSEVCIPDQPYKDIPEIILFLDRQIRNLFKVLVIEDLADDFDPGISQLYYALPIRIGELCNGNTIHRRRDLMHHPGHLVFISDDLVEKLLIAPIQKCIAGRLISQIPLPHLFIRVIQAKQLDLACTAKSVELTPETGLKHLLGEIAERFGILRGFEEDPKLSHDNGIE